jgi:hypothetical protein
MNFFTLLLDLPRRYQICFQDPITPVMSAVVDLNTYISAFLILILIFVAFQIIDVLLFFRVDRDYGLAFVSSKEFKRRNRIFGRIAKKKDYIKKI